MTELNRMRRQQILREAEGYLDLITVMHDRWRLSAPVRQRLAQRALDALDRLTRRDARRSQALHLRGLALRELQRYSDAVLPLQEAAELDPENIHIWMALAWCHKRCGRLDLAIQSLEEALIVDSSEAVIYYNLACYWSLADNVKKSLQFLAQAFDIDPNYRDLVADEPDFDPIRKHPDFQTLTSVIV